MHERLITFLDRRKFITGPSGGISCGNIGQRLGREVPVARQPNAPSFRLELIRDFAIYLVGALVRGRS